MLTELPFIFFLLNHGICKMRVSIEQLDDLVTCSPTLAKLICMKLRVNIFFRWNKIFSSIKSKSHQLHHTYVYRCNILFTFIPLYIKNKTKLPIFFFPVSRSIRDRVWDTMILRWCLHIYITGLVNTVQRETLTQKDIQ